MSSATARTTSSGSDSGGSGPRAVLDQRKRKRMESNRKSARRSRMRKQQHVDDLIGQEAKLQGENAQVAAQIGAFAHQLSRLGAENAVLQAQVAELTERLHSLNSVLRVVEDFSGVAMDIPEIPDPLLRPWQLPCPSQAITASAMFPY